MGNEVWFKRDPGDDYFFIIRRPSDQKVFFPDNVVTGHDDTYGGSAAMESWGASGHSLADYGIEAVGDEGGLYAADFPGSLPEGRYLIEVYEQVNVSPSYNSVFNNSYAFFWTGKSEIDLLVISRSAYLRANKSVQDKTTGVITTYDVDGSTPLYVETETDNGDGTITVEVMAVT
ncbi:MAG: hypothetical protein GY869_06645 [Planctomycetes bacterium]|nr:hypothetical protein [Planctomycetota bacterium]